MNVARMPRWFLLGFLALVLVSAVSALAAANTVPTSHLMDQSQTVEANQLKPPDCSALNLTAVVVCPSSGGTCNGGDANELILGSPYNDDIDGGKGDDCMVGGAGDDTFKGKQGTDVCIGGAGTDSFHPSCETQIQ